MKENALNKQIGGNHYQAGAMQPIEFISINNIPFSAGNAIKYVFRHRNKNGLQDLEKAMHYIEFLEQYHSFIAPMYWIVLTEEFANQVSLGDDEESFIYRICEYLRTKDMIPLNQCKVILEKLMSEYE